MSGASHTVQQNAARNAISEALRELTVVSDEARFQIHLFSLEAKRRWNEIESKLRHLEARMAQGTDETDATKELSQAIRELLTHRRSAESPPTPVRALMARQVATCRSDQTLSDAAGAMARAQCNALAVVDEGGRFVGVLSEHDVCMGAYSSGTALSETPIAATMRGDVETLKPDDTVANAAELMRFQKLEYVPVVDEEGSLAGMLWLRDLARRVEAEDEPSFDPAWLAATVVDAYAR
ncbi:MAG TPA: CBS domain-containing protein [Polyangiaceae bacterium]|nr:CBS domain-containing protein [Polyangiaceae bacterium]